MKRIRSDFNSRQYMLAEDFELYYYSDVNFQNVGSHSHAYYEVYLFSEGCVDMVIDGKTCSLRAGDMIIVPPQTMHRAIIKNREVPYQRFVFWVSKDYCERLSKESEDYLYLFRHAEKEKEYVYHLNLLDFNGIRGKLSALLEELHTNRFGRDTQIDLSVRDLVLTLNRMIYQQKHPMTRRENLSSYQAITEYISNHLEEDLSLDALSREFYLNKYYIGHLIQENTGVSLHQYILKKRLAACCDAMLGGQSIGSCCARYGFLNYSSFYRAFRKEYAMSPSEFLQNRSNQ
ncbi:MAG: helix-turn-helix domain-containing protein [Oscillospiraceae bacterium]|nr:helix-turn-helix domain-containing protein [Oscillospiraceae bacterium]